MRFLLPLFCGVLAGCGANVVVGEGGEGGDGSTPGDELREECRQFCDEQAACPTADPSCDASCEQIDTLMPASCTDELQSYLACFNSLPNPCAPGFEDCSSESQAIATCFATACSQEPDDPACSGF